MRVSMSLDSLERSSTELQSGDSTTESQEEEKQMLRKKKDTLEAKLKDSRVLSVQVRERPCWSAVCHQGFGRIWPVLLDNSHRRKSRWSCWRKTVKLWMQLWSLKTAVYKKDRRG